MTVAPAWQEWLCENWILNLKVREVAAVHCVWECTSTLLLEKWVIQAAVNDTIKLKYMCLSETGHTAECEGSDLELQSAPSLHLNQAEFLGGAGPNVIFNIMGFKLFLRRYWLRKRAHWNVIYTNISAPEAEILCLLELDCSSFWMSNAEDWTSDEKYIRAMR